ncbi:SGNH/GDSL hydrolase family protein [Planctomonas sp. JC2975]|uniref:SGNH/GDSL hydrolase family protein n=1 Tax=Planctomonas sp. JC2975 TaxID=2729626 RepID=UPI001474ED85|nr:SGNH/GDSL hydrolase family protein [Planctomonas sp. JC2975]NNC12927.1 SGNH/GDSL hydrolase family protein [Planctomonas sp. JC2975]
MRRRNPTPRTRAAACALGLVAVLLTGCSGSGQSGSPASGAPSAPTATATPLPAPTSTMRTPTAADPLRYAALGDSYSAGMGGGSEIGRCLRSPHAFPQQLAKAKTIELARFVACSGATTTDVLSTQIAALDPQVELVTITIGGNDLNVSALPSACARGETSTCRAAVATSVSLLKTLPTKLEKTYKAIAKAAPNARILVADYPLFYDLPTITEKTIGSDQVSAAIAVDAAVASLDATIEKAVAQQRDAGTDIHFVDVSFIGHGVNSPKPWFVLTGPNAFHPTAAGYAQYATVLGDFVR